MFLKLVSVIFAMIIIGMPGVMLDCVGIPS
jgi:hypothetical protein